MTLSAVLSLAIGLGASSAVFSLVDAVDLRGLPYAESDRLVSIQLYRPLGGFCPGCRVPSPEPFTRRVARAGSFDAVSAYRSFGLTLRDEVGADFIRATEVGPEHFKLLGMAPLLGRAIQWSDLEPDAGPVLVAKYDFWRKSLHGDESVVGRRLAFISDQEGTSRAFTVIGVMPRRFDVPANTDAWVARRQDVKGLWMVGLLKNDVQPERAEAESRKLLSAAANEDATLVGASVKVLSLRQDQRAWWGVTNRRFVLAGVVALVLLLAFTNLVTLFLSRLVAMDDELATRTALGASQSRLVGQVMTDVLFVGLLGAGCGLWVTYLGMQLLTKRLGYSAVPLAFSMRVGLFDLALGLVVSLAIGAVAGVSIKRMRIADRLRSATSAGVAHRGGSGIPMQRVAMVVQVAGAVLFTSAALQGIRQLVRVNDVDIGFNPAGLVRIIFSSDNQPRLPFQQEMAAAGAADAMRARVAMDVRRLGAIRGVQKGGSAVAARPSQDKVEVEGLQSGDEIPQMSVTSDYFRAIGIPIEAGRAFSDADRESGPAVAILSRRASERLWRTGSPVGKRLTIRSGGGEREELTVIGQVPDVRFTRAGPRGVVPILYRPFEQLPSAVREYWIRSERTSDPRVVLPGLFQAIAELRPDLAKARYPSIQVLSDQLDREIAGPRLNATALSALAVFAAALAAIGTFGIVAYSVRVRTREIGIRLALGASSSRVFQVVAAGTVALGALGIALGAIGSFAVIRLARASFAGLEPPSGGLVIVSALASAVVILAATYWPARRALERNPTESLRMM